MYTDINQRIIETKEKLWKKRKYSEHIIRANQILDQQQTKALKLQKKLEKEQSFVEKLQRISLSRIYFSIIGNKEEKLDSAKQEVLAQQLKYEEALETIGEIKFEIEALTRKHYSVSNAESEYNQLLVEKERLIHEKNSIWSEPIFQLALEEGEIIALLTENQEAMEAGHKAKQALATALSSLEKAKGWSTWDMIGGGMISTAIKHSHLDVAKSHIHKAQTKLRHFQDELADINNHSDIHINIDGLLTFADYFFDGLLFDWVVHGRINDSIHSVERAKDNVEIILNILKDQRSEQKKILGKLKEQRTALIEEATH